MRTISSAPFLRVLADEHHRAAEVRVHECGSRDQKLPFQRLHSRIIATWTVCLARFGSSPDHKAFRTRTLRARGVADPGSRGRQLPVRNLLLGRSVHASAHERRPLVRRAVHARGSDDRRRRRPGRRVAKRALCRGRLGQSTGSAGASGRSRTARAFAGSTLERPRLHLARRSRDAGLHRYYGLYELGVPKEGETVFVSGLPARWAVRSVSSRRSPAAASSAAPARRRRLRGFESWVRRRVRLSRSLRSGSTQTPRPTASTSTSTTSVATRSKPRSAR